MKSSTFLLLLCLSSCSAAHGHGYFMYADFRCNIHPAGPQRVEYLIDWYFNKEFMMQYNSTLGKWTGLTPAGLISASVFNENPFDVLQRKEEKQLICVDNVGHALNATRDNIAAPSVRLVEASGSGGDTTLVCSAYDFYPRHIQVAWLRDGQEVTSGVTSSEVLTNGNWTYLVHSYLRVTPGGRDRVTCKVEHVSLKEPKLRTWAEHEARDSETGFLLGGACALLLGTACLSSGLMVHRRRRYSNVL
ncbi:rano class II histocompatibility antigen, A beta chain-like isoform X1 [Pungitius pungitius]|uniref:rano class II histocompatibility antigen, A beta chain-like isoform X1 n=2 Tax=Pungitius pungitius TaxID=134920 RepID=UPI002E102B8D